MGNEREQDAWLGNTLRRSPAAASDACLDAETLAAWADGGLNAQAAAAVELHASNCSHCMAVLAAMERTAPVAAVADAWTLARVFRWVAPLAAAATAVAIWIAVPDRPVTPVASTISQDRAEQNQQVPGSGFQVPGSGSSSGSGSGSGTLNQNPEPRTGNAELGTRNPEPGTRNQEPQERSQFGDEFRRERAEPQALGSVAAPAPPAAPEAAPFAPEARRAADASAPSAAPQPPPAAPAPRAFAADTIQESATAATAERSNLVAKIVVTSESTAQNPLFRWRVVGNASIERSTDGGKTWTKTIPIPGVATNKPGALTIASIRAMSDVTAIATTSGGDFLTTNGGMSWTPVQEK